jgi:hypothetical protein
VSDLIAYNVQGLAVGRAFIAASAHQTTAP